MHATPTQQMPIDMVIIKFVNIVKIGGLWFCVCGAAPIGGTPYAPGAACAVTVVAATAFADLGGAVGDTLFATSAAPNCVAPEGGWNPIETSGPLVVVTSAFAASHALPDVTLESFVCFCNADLHQHLLVNGEAVPKTKYPADLHKFTQALMLATL
jgi:hypothetical protein